MRRLAPVLLAFAATLCGGCGGAAPTTPASAPPQAVDRLKPHPRAIDPSAGVPAGRSGVYGFRAPATASGRLRATSRPLPRPKTDAQIRRELAASGIPSGATAALTHDGLAVAPLAAPAVVQAVIQAGNQIARLPYRYGGGHATWIDTAYDCSASISFAFAAAGLISTPMVSGQLAQWGDPGPGRWITIYANGGHTFMLVAGLRFDTSGLSATGSRWQASARPAGGFAVRHPVGL